MKRHSRVHMLTVAAARLEQDYGNPKLIAALRDAVKEEAKKLSEGRGCTEEDERRVERQRSLLTMCEYTRGVERLKEAMCQRAYDLMWSGDALAADAILEFLPAEDAEKVLNAWERDQEPRGEKSRWYEGKA